MIRFEIRSTDQRAQIRLYVGDNGEVNLHASSDGIQGYTLTARDAEFLGDLLRSLPDMFRFGGAHNLP